MHTNETYYTEVHVGGENIKMAAEFRRVQLTGRMASNILAALG